jgi:hypothetical protein
LGSRQLSFDHQIRPYASDLQDFHPPGILHPKSPFSPDHPGRFLPADDLRGQEEEDSIYDSFFQGAGIQGGASFQEDR